jgi:membrane protease YdiL (CAAX protease family)
LGLPAVIILYLLQAGLEELGWRGYLLDRLQARWQPLTAALILGVFHTFWHLPDFWIVGTNQNRWGLGIETALFFAVVMGNTIFASWCYNANRRSTLAVILLHTTLNLFLDTFLLPGTGEWIFKIMMVLFAVTVGLSLPLLSYRRRYSDKLSLVTGSASELFGKEPSHD